MNELACASSVYMLQGDAGFTTIPLHSAKVGCEPYEGQG